MLAPGNIKQIGARKRGGAPFSRRGGTVTVAPAADGRRHGALGFEAGALVAGKYRIAARIGGVDPDLPRRFFRSARASDPSRPTGPARVARVTLRFDGFDAASLAPRNLTLGALEASFLCDFEVELAGQVG